METKKINNIEIQFNKEYINKFLNSISYPIAIIDFETFRTLKTKQVVNSSLEKEFSQKIFSVSCLIFNDQNELKIENLNNKKKQLFSKTEIYKHKEFKNFEKLLKYQSLFFNFLIEKLIKHNVKSLVFLGASTEVNLLKNYLVYFSRKARFHKQVNDYFHSKNIFDLYDIWNHDEVFSIPEFKLSKKQQIGATKKTISLIKTNSQYNHFLKPFPILSNNDVGRIIDQYFLNNCSLMPSFLDNVKKHNRNDVLIGAFMMSLFYSLSH